VDQQVIFVGLDVHKATIAVALAPEGRSNEIRFQGSVPHRPGAIADLGRRLQTKHPGARLTFCYEAGSCGYGLARELTDAGHECLVIAPSLIPTRPASALPTPIGVSCRICERLACAQRAFPPMDR